MKPTLDGCMRSTLINLGNAAVTRRSRINDVPSVD
jgi:hypothetical protein